jgi:hypothetical protein
MKGTYMDLHKQFGQLAERFQRCESHDDLQAAQAWGGKLLKLATEAECFPFWAMPLDLAGRWLTLKFWREDDDPNKAPTGDWPSPGVSTFEENEDWGMVWQSGYQITYEEFRDRLPNLTWECSHSHRSVTFTRTPTWREIAETYAIMAELIAEETIPAEFLSAPMGKAEGAKKMDISVSTLNRQIKDGRTKCFRINRERWRFDTRDFS